jgi:hypothetical protein
MIPFRAFEMRAVQWGICSRVYPIPILTKSYGLVLFTPIKVYNVLITSFEMHSRYPLIDINCMRGTSFPYMYDEVGKKSHPHLYDYAAEYEGQVANIRASKELRDGDILLCNERLKNIMGIDRVDRADSILTMQ